MCMCVDVFTGCRKDKLKGLDNKACKKKEEKHHEVSLTSLNVLAYALGVFIILI